MQALGRIFLGDGNLPDGAVQFARVAEIDRVDRRNRRAGNLFAAHVHAQPGLREDHELGASVVSFDVARGIGFGETQFLSLLERGRESRAGRLHFREDIVAGAVQNSRDAIKPVARQPFLNGDDGGDSSRHRSAKLKLPSRLPRQAQKFRPAVRDQQFVGRDHGFTRAQGLAHPFARGLEAAHDFHQNIRVRGQHVVNIFGPAHAPWNPVHFFPLDIAVADLRQHERAVPILREQLGYRAPHGSEADESDLELPGRGRALRRSHFVLEF